MPYSFYIIQTEKEPDFELITGLPNKTYSKFSFGFTINPIAYFVNATNINPRAAINAIIEPLPVSYSAEKYNPKITISTPIICDKITQERKLLPIN